MSKIKICKVVPYQQFTVTKNQPFLVDDKKYVNAPTNLQENSTGFPLYLYLIIILPEANHDYQYLKIDMKVQNLQFKTILNKKQQIFKGIKRGNLKRQSIFQFIPSVKGSYALTVDCSYRPQFFVQSSQPPPQKRDNNQMTIKCQQPFQVKQHILSEDKVSSITFPLFLQYSIQSKLFGDLVCDVQFTSDKFKFKQLHNQNKIRLKKEEIYYLMYQIEPKSLKEVMSQKGITIGSLNVKYGAKGNHQKKTSLKASNKFVFFKANTITKEVPKKDIVQVETVFSKIYNVSFNLGNLKLVINEKQMPEVKILKTSVDRINLDQNRSVSVIFSVICLKSGPVHLKGITLQGNQDITVYFINQLTLNVGIEQEKKTQIMLENTSEFYVDSLL